MDNFNSSVLFMIVSFSLAAVVIWRRESLPERLKRPLALLTVLMVCAAFIMFIVSLFKMD